MNNFDVIIIGAGISGNFLAQEILKQNRSRKIAIIEKDTQPKRKVGESCSDITAVILNTLIDKNLLKTQVQKTGLSFLFKNGQKFLSPSQKSMANGYQLDRESFDQSLITQNAKNGIQYFLGSRVQTITKNQPYNYTVSIDTDSTNKKISSTWIIDCSGKSRFFYKYFKLSDLDVKHPIASTWCYINSKDIIFNHKNPKWDSISIGSQKNSTLHLFGKGYWWWLFPINDEVFSLGLVYDKTLFLNKNAKEIFDEVRTSDENIKQIVNFPRELRFKHLDQVSYMSEKQLTDGLLMIGDAYGFVDPFLSGGLEFSLQQSLYYSKLINRNLEGKNISNKSWLKADCIFNNSLKSRFFLLEEKYKLFDDSDISTLWIQFDFLGYIIRYVLPSVFLPKVFAKFPIRVNSIEKYFYNIIRKRFITLYNIRKQTTPPSKAVYPLRSYSSVAAPRNIFKASYTSLSLIFIFLKNYLKLEISVYKNKPSQEDTHVVAE